MPATTDRILDIGRGEYDNGHCHLHVYNRNDLSDDRAKCHLEFSKGNHLTGLTGFEQARLCDRIRAAMDLLSVIEEAPESSEPLTDAELAPWARKLIRVARERKIL